MYYNTVTEELHIVYYGGQSLLSKDIRGRCYENYRITWFWKFWFLVSASQKLSWQTFGDTVLRQSQRSGQERKQKYQRGRIIGLQWLSRCEESGRKECRTTSKCLVFVDLVDADFRRRSSVGRWDCWSAESLGSLSHLSGDVLWCLELSKEVCSGDRGLRQQWTEGS